MIVDSMTHAYFGHIRAHWDAEQFYRQVGDSNGYAREAAIVRAFVRSIGQNNGQSAQTAMLVTSLDEEYIFLATHNVRLDRQSLLFSESGSAAAPRFDLMECTDTSTGRKVRFYFRLNW
jgi:hypothetical protein